MIFIWRQARAFARETLFPHGASCLCCCDPRFASPGDCLCDACRARLAQERLTGPACPKCATPLDEHGRCPFCRGRGLAFCRAALAPFAYRGDARRLALLLKYGYQDEAACALGQAMAQALRAHARWDALVPVPLYPARERARGDNQARLLAREVSRRTGLPVLELLTRVRDTRAQASLTALQRAQNVRFAFAAREDARGKRLLLIDDVRTTGATLSACAEALTQAGAAQAGALTAAVTLKYEGGNGLYG